MPIIARGSLSLFLKTHSHVPAVYQHLVRGIHAVSTYPILKPRERRVDRYSAIVSRLVSPMIILAGHTMSPESSHQNLPLTLMLTIVTVHFSFREHCIP